jgi:hypothetical protein
VASAAWDGALNSWFPVSYEAMGRWMLEEAAANCVAAPSVRAADEPNAASVPSNRNLQTICLMIVGRSNKSFDRSGGCAFCIIIGSARLE